MSRYFALLVLLPGCVEDAEPILPALAEEIAGDAPVEEAEEEAPVEEAPVEEARPDAAPIEGEVPDAAPVEEEIELDPLPGDCGEAQADIRAVEECARETACEDGWGTDPVSLCVGELECQEDRLIQAHQDNAHRCQRNHFTRAGEAEGWSCLGEVHVSAIIECLGLWPCEEVTPCLEGLELP